MTRNCRKIRIAGRILRLTKLVVPSVLVMTLVGCSSPKLAPTPQPTLQSPATGISVATPSIATPETTRKPCDSGRLEVGDLPAMDLALKAGVEVASERALDWQQDAVLSSLRVACQLFETGFRWQATFYSRNAQAFYSSDTGELVPSGIEGEAPALDVNQLSFNLLHEALTLSGYDDSTKISPSTGVEIQFNSPASPFGPPSAPSNVILYHVAIERLGEVKDIFVDGRDGAVYWYTD